MRLDPGKTSVEYGTLHGGLSQDEARGVTLAGGDAWIAGVTHSPNLATTAGAARWSGGNCSFLRDSFEFPSCSDAFIARIDEARPPTPQPDPDPDPEPGATPVGDPGPNHHPGGGTGASGDGRGTPTARRIERALVMRMHGSRLTGRVDAAGVRPCASQVPVRLERQRHGRWHRIRSARTRTNQRFTFTLPRTRHPLRVRLPQVTRTHDHATVRCVAVKRRIRRAR